MDVFAAHMMQFLTVICQLKQAPWSTCYINQSDFRVQFRFFFNC